MTIQKQSQDDLFRWADGTLGTREEWEDGGYSHMSDDFEVIPVGSPEWDSLSAEYVDQ
jgi:hypothetical protein